MKQWYPIYLISFIDNRTRERKFVAKFDNQAEAIRYCKQNAYYNQGRWVNRQGTYIIGKGIKTV
jgi:hypothetical protein